MLVSVMSVVIMARESENTEEIGMESVSMKCGEEEPTRSVR